MKRAKRKIMNKKNEKILKKFHGFSFQSDVVYKKAIVECLIKYKEIDCLQWKIGSISMKTGSSGLIVMPVIIIPTKMKWVNHSGKEHNVFYAMKSIDVPH